jgi:hypothetical protein
MAVVVVVVVPRLVSTHTKKEESNSSILDALSPTIQPNVAERAHRLVFREP